MVNLDVHSIYSTKRSIITIDKLLGRIREFGQTACGLCDDSALYGALEFYDKCLKANIKPIIGTQFNFCDDINVKDKSNYQIILIAKNIYGYRNLCKLITKAYLDGFYYVPRIDLASLKAYSENLICVLCGVSNPVFRPLVENQEEYSTYHDTELNDIFFGDVYYSVSPSVNDLNIRWAKHAVKNYPMNYLVTNHARFLLSSEYEFYDMMFCMNKNLLFKNPTREHADTSLYLKSEEEILNTEFGLTESEIKQGMETSEFIAEIVDLKFEKKLFFPKFTDSKEKSEKLLKDKLNEGWQKRKINTKQEDIVKYKERVVYEYEVITRLGYTDYFLIVADIINFAKKNDIPTGTGRGSAAGSLISYLLGITNLDPIRHDLLFERFLDPTGQRVSPPDIDNDIADIGRERVVQYIIDTYGADKVAPVGNLSTLAFKLSIKDVAKTFDIPFERVNGYTKEIPFFIHTKDEYANYKRTKSTYKSNEEIRTLLYYADGIKGSMKNLGTNAAGIIIAPSKITDFTPLQLVKNTTGEKITTQLDKDSVESIGLLKIDILGLTALTIIDKTIKLIKQNKNLTIDLDSIDLDNEEIYDIVNNGNTVGLFQLESEGMTDLANRMAIKTNRDVCDLIALHRPAILEANLHELYLQNKKSEERISIHPLLDEITLKTYNVLLYQEDMMQASVKMAKFTMAEADTLRRSIGKKSVKDIPILREKFITGCLSNNVSQEDAENVFSIFENAGYCFNLSHSMSYAVTTSQTCYLKTYYPLEFICANLISESEKHDRIKILVKEANNLNIEILPPDINKSDSTFSIENNKIRYGFSSIKGIGEGFVQDILDQRKISPFKSFSDFIKKMDKIDKLTSNKTKIKVLIECGCFDGFDPNRNRVLSELEGSLGVSRRGRTKNKTSLFNVIDSIKNETKINDLPQFRKRFLEEDHLGISFSI